MSGGPKPHNHSPPTEVSLIVGRRDDKVYGMTKKRGVAIIGGKYPKKSIARSIVAGSELVIAADSGLDTAAAYGIDVDFVVGDFDSLKDRSLLSRLSADRVLSFPEDKDFTDTELAVQELRARGCEDVVILGGGGGRLDHIFALHHMMFRADGPTAWLTHRDEVIAIRDRFSSSGDIGTVVSFFPAPGPTVRMRSWGLRWPLDTLAWNMGDFGVSNRISEREYGVELIEGRLLHIRPHSSYFFHTTTKKD